MLRYKLRAAAAYTCLVISVLLGEAVPWLVKESIDRGLTQGEQAILIYAAIGIVAVTAFRAVFSYVQGYFGEYISQRVAYDLRNALYDRFQRLSFSFHDNIQTGQLMSRATADVEGVRMFIAMGAMVIISTIFMFMTILALLISLNWRLALVTMAFIPLMALSAVSVGRTLRPMFLRVQEELAAMTEILQESLAGVRVVKAFAREEFQIDRFSKQVKVLFDWNIKSARQQAFNMPVLNLLLGIAVGATLWYGGNEVFAGRLTLGGLVAFNGYLAMLIMPVRRLGFMTMLIARAVSAGERIFEILDASAEISDAPNAIEMPNVEGRVRFDNVSFKYGSASPTLKNVDLDVRPGEAIAVLGNTGSGKSTLVNLLPRFYDVSNGRITIDGTDIRDVTVASLRRQIGIVLQETFLFSATIRDNIAYGSEGASMDQIVAAAKAARAHDFIMSFPDGYDTWVGERGTTLSGGQRQRVAIARTLLLDPRILIFDDSTSSVDAETENLIRQALANLMKGRTTFIIAHRLGTVKNANRIIVLDRGQIVEEGTHLDLLDRHGFYKHIYDLQLKGQEEEEQEALALAPIQAPQQHIASSSRNGGGQEIPSPSGRVLG
jgi:ATP-binding cassette subfamily B protein